MLTWLMGYVTATFTICAEVDSADTRTSGFYVTMHVVAENNATTLQTPLSTSEAFDADTITWSPGDQFIASTARMSVPLVKTESSAYRDFLNSAPDGTEIKVFLCRENDTDAQDSLVIIPDQLDVSVPNQAETFNAGESITLAWFHNPLNTVDVSFFINCQVEDENGIPTGATYGRISTMPDSGTYTAVINAILNVVGTQGGLISGVSCSLEITIKRINAGTLDSAFTKGGTKTPSNFTFYICLLRAVFFPCE